MKKYLIIIGLTAAITFGDFYFASAQAVPKPAPPGFTYSVSALTLSYLDQKITIDSNTLKQWQGETQWQPYSTVQWQPQNLNKSLAAYYGLISQSEPVAPKIYHYRVDKIYSYLQTLSDKINQPSIEPKLSIENGKVTDFAPPQNGLSLDAYQSALNIADALEQNQNTVALTISQTSPQNSLMQTNSLGINELIAEGVSNFAGSPNNRRHNIAVGIEKFKGILVAQGATFSFDDSLGPVDGDHGFLPELVIKSNSTVPEFGGGLCQVSTTTFRAAQAAGVAITDRRKHA
jgi:vancomycin resistance protein YoaR